MVAIRSESRPSAYRVYQGDLITVVRSAVDLKMCLSLMYILDFNNNPKAIKKFAYPLARCALRTTRSILIVV